MYQPAVAAAPVSGEAWLLLGTIVTAAGGLFGTWRQLKQQARQTKTTDAQQIIDQLQEIGSAAEERHQREVDTLEGRYLRELVEVRLTVTELTGRVNRVEGRERVLLDYVAALRFHIDQGRPPPPPEWPPQLVQPIS